MKNIKIIFFLLLSANFQLCAGTRTSNKQTRWQKFQENIGDAWSDIKDFPSTVTQTAKEEYRLWKKKRGVQKAEKQAQDIQKNVGLFTEAIWDGNADQVNSIVQNADIGKMKSFLEDSKNIETKDYLHAGLQHVRQESSKEAASGLTNSKWLNTKRVLQRFNRLSGNYLAEILPGWDRVL